MTEFDVLVVRELDRFARSLAKQLIIETELRRADVEIDYVLGEYPDTPEGNLMKNVRAVVAEYERLKIVERSNRGKRNKVRDGHVMVNGHAPYGYRVTERDGKDTFGIHEPEARIVRLIFGWYANGEKKIRGVALELREMGVLTPSGGSSKWNISTVGYILNIETYAGTWRYGKAKQVNGHWVRNPQKHLLGVQVPAIIDRQTWDAVQARLEENRQGQRRKPKYEYLFRRRVTCACLLKMTCASRKRKRTVSRYYRCPVGSKSSTGHHTRTCTENTHFRADIVDAAVWEKVKGWITEPDQLIEELNAFRAEMDRENEPLRERLAVIDDLLADNRRQLERLLDLYLSGEFDKAILASRRDQLERTISALERERATLAATLDAQTLTDAEIEDIKALSAEMCRGIDFANDDFATRREVIEVIDVQVKLTTEGNEQIAWVTCKLLGKAERVSLSSNSSPGDSKARYDRQSRGRSASSAAPGPEGATGAATPGPAYICRR